MQSSETSTESLVLRLSQDEVSIQEILPLLKHTSPLVRINGFLSMNRQMEGIEASGEHEEALIDNLVGAAKDPDNFRRVMGKRLVDFAVASLLTMRTQKAEMAALQVLKGWSQDERYDILSWSNRLDLMSQEDLRTYAEKQDRLKRPVL